MRNLDLWLEYVETTEKLPLFSQETKKYTLPNRTAVVSPSDPSWLIEIVTHNDLALLTCLESIDQYKMVFTTIQRTNDKGFLLKCFEHILGNIENIVVDKTKLFKTMIEFLAIAPTMALAFVPFFESPGLGESQDLYMLLTTSLPLILRAFILSANIMGHLIIKPLKTILSIIPPGSLSLSDVADLIELVALTIRSTSLALDLLLDCLQPNALRFITTKSEVAQHLLRNLSAVAVDHIEEAENVARRQQGFFDLKLYPKAKEGNVIEVDFRIDDTGTPKVSSHVRITTASSPSNVLVGKDYYSMDALAVSSETGRARFKCLHPLPPYFADCSWVIDDCGPFVTTKTMIDAVKDFDTLQESCCGVASIIIGIPLSSSVLPATERGWNSISTLNKTQNQAIRLALKSSLLCLLGPPGTGKTRTIIEIICALQTAYKGRRVLVTAPTHDAVDNVMRRYIQRIQGQKLAKRFHPYISRVSTEVGFAHT